jgi:hypothetical protein
MRKKELAAAFGAGCVNLAPGIVLILRPYSVSM